MKRLLVPLKILMTCKVLSTLMTLDPLHSMLVFFFVQLEVACPRAFLYVSVEITVIYVKQKTSNYNNFLYITKKYTRAS